MPNNLSVLAVGHDPATQASLMHDLSPEGFTVKTAATSEQAIALMASECFSIVLMEVRLRGPGMDGFGLLTHIKKTQPETRVLLLTERADLKNAIAAKKRGAEDFISLPYDLADLLTTMMRVLSKEPSFPEREY